MANGRRFQQLIEEHWIPVVQLGVNGDPAPHKPQHAGGLLDLLTGIDTESPNRIDTQPPSRKGTVMHWVELGTTIVFQSQDYTQDEGEMPSPNMTARSQVLHPGNRFKHLLAEHFSVASSLQA